MDDFDDSALGTVEHWENVYQREIQAYEECNDVGEIWFGETCLKKVLLKANSLFPEEDKSHLKVLDIGTGNGYTLIKLEKKYRFVGELIGTDYAPAAVEFARSLASKEGCAHTQFVVDDFLQSSLLSASPACCFSLILDKGTYDAISLRSDSKEARGKYIQTVRQLIVPEKGRFLITSCNWTRDELVAHFTPAGFVVEGQIDYPTFQFGGGKGSTTSSVIFSFPQL